MKRIEFYVALDGVVVATCDREPAKEYKESDREITMLLLLAIGRQYPAALEALQTYYQKYKRNKQHYEYLCVHRFIRCNLGKADQLSWDIEGGVLHLEDTTCPLKWGNECPLMGVVCKPLPFGLTKREMEVAKLSSSGITYKEMSVRLGLAHNTIKNILQRIKKKLHLTSSKDIAKLIVATVLTQ